MRANGMPLGSTPTRPRSRCAATRPAVIVLTATTPEPNCAASHSIRK